MMMMTNLMTMMMSPGWQRNEEPENGVIWTISKYDDDDFDDNDNDDEDDCVFYDDATCMSSVRSQYLPVRGNGQSHWSSLICFRIKMMLPSIIIIIVIR